MEQQTKEKNSKKKIIAGILIFAVVILAFVGIYLGFGAKGEKGEKEITISVVSKDENTTTYDVKTDAEYLRQAMEEADGLTFDGTEGDYGYMIESVNGEVADYNTDQSYWAIYVNDEYGNYGIDSQPVNDGDAFALIYTTDE